jgi:hypothetical protein
LPLLSLAARQLEPAPLDRAARISQHMSRSYLKGLAFAVGLAACSSTEPSASIGTVRFQLVAPLCSSVLPVTFRIDNAQVGQDTFRVAVALEHLTSAAFAVTAGAHVLGASVIGGYVWPDTTVGIVPGDTVTRLLPFYCS